MMGKAMHTLQEVLIEDGAALAPDGIPLHFGDLAGEYYAALEHAVLMNRSHEGRLQLTGRDRLALLHRISTNDLESLKPGEGRPTIFTNANARILERATIYNDGDSVLALTEPGRAQALMSYLQRNIFFNDDIQISDLTPTTQQLDVHGPKADDVMARITAAWHPIAPMSIFEARLGASARILAARNKPLVGSHWTIITVSESAATTWDELLSESRDLGLRPAGSLTYNALRIRAGRPAVGRELSTEYIPLEIGLWDEISFQKGCYTGQEIIARMESRNRLARVMVRLTLDSAVDAPAELYHNGRAVGTLTSSVTTPDGEHLGIGVIKTAVAEDGLELSAGANHVPARMVDFAGAPPPMLAT
jgi:tRNA-modifying protein YgfZ